MIPPAPGRRRWAPIVAVLLATALTACAAPDEDGSGSHALPSATALIPDAGQSGTVVVPDAGQLRGRDPEPPTTLRSSLARDLGEDLQAGQLLVPPEPPATGTWKFISTTAAGPVVFDACRPIHYRLHRGPGPANGPALVEEAFARVSAATGLRFVLDGPLDTVPSSSMFPAPNTTVALGEAFAPVAVGWAERSETDLWASESADTLGVGGPRTIVFRDAERLTVSGFVLLTPSATLKAGFGPGLTVGNVLLHEIGHLVGLDHVDAPDELMQPRLDRSTPDGYGPGDRRGLWELGASRGCASSYLHPG